DSYWTLAVDDSPTKRYGRHGEAANIHHNPTPGPGDGDWLYGHNWVCLAMVLSHPIFGVVALPLLSRLYVRKVDMESLKGRYEWEFRTKHELALDLAGESSALSGHSVRLPGSWLSLMVLTRSRHLSVRCLPKVRAS